MALKLATGRANAKPPMDTAGHENGIVLKALDNPGAGDRRPGFDDGFSGLHRVQNPGSTRHDSRYLPAAFLNASLIRSCHPGPSS
jgi:hypothetical protein